MPELAVKEYVLLEYRPGPVFRLSWLLGSMKISVMMEINPVACTYLGNLGGGWYYCVHETLCLSLKIV